VTRPEGSALAEAGANMLPVDFERTSQTSPIFNYPYRAAREALDRLSRARDPDGCHGFKMAYVNPLTGGAAMPTMTTAMQLLPKGFASEPYRSTAGTVFSVVEGAGVVEIEGQRFDFGPRDLFVAPSWHGFSIEAAEDTVVFTYSDRVVQEKLDIFREQRGKPA
jgi:gentisate 1,2-dioxygenase